MLQRDMSGPVLVGNGLTGIVEDVENPIPLVTRFAVRAMSPESILHK